MYNEELIVRVVELKGSYYELGLFQGKEMKSYQSQEQLESLKESTKYSNVQRAKEKISEISPNLLQEIEGMADGLNIELDFAIQLFSGYDVVFPTMGCTTLVTDGHYVRNYDFSPEMYDARLVFTKPVDGYSSVGFSQQVIGRLDGMNEKGLVVGLHFVNNEHRGEGFIATTIVRMVLEQCATIEEAVKLITTIPHGYCYNYSLTDQGGRSVKVEASPQQQSIHYSTPLLCTNHFESAALKDKNRMHVDGSVKRQEYLRSLILGSLPPMSLYHHFNDESSPLFFNYYKEYFGTLHTVIYKPEDLSIIIGVGRNCEPVLFSLKDYLEGKLMLPETIKGVIQNSK